MASSGDHNVKVKMETLSSQLKSAIETFKSKAEALFLSRENALQKQIQNHQHHNKLLSKENAQLKIQLETLKEQVSDKKCLSLSEREELERETKKLLEEEQEKVFDLKRKNCELECMKLKAETEVDIWKRKFVDLNKRLRFDVAGNEEVGAFGTEASEVVVTSNETAKQENGSGDVRSIAVHVQPGAVNSSEIQPVKDPSSSTFTWRIENFSKLSARKLYSDSFTVDGCTWWVLVYPKGDNEEKFFSMYLCAYGHSRYAQVSLAVVNPINGKYTIRRETQQWFGAVGSSWGSRSFALLSELHDPSIGYLVNDTLTVEAEVRVPKVVNVA